MRQTMVTLNLYKNSLHSLWLESANQIAGCPACEKFEAHQTNFLINWWQPTSLIPIKQQTMQKLAA